jgi:TrmH family RNA methyltransferase
MTGTSSLLDAVHVVLVRPQTAGNLGSVARAMKNFGLRRLTIVESQIGSMVDAFQMAVHAHDVLDGARHLDDVATAVVDARWVVGTTNRPPAGMQVMTPREVVEAIGTRGPPTLLFGGELHGLTQSELLHCHVASMIPVTTTQSSLNLAQAVCVYAAELFAVHGATHADHLVLPAVPMADTNLMHRLEVALANLLDDSSYRDATRPKNALAELMQPLWRANLTDDEVRAWLTALNKAVQRPR